MDWRVITDPDLTLLFLYSERALDRELTHYLELEVVASDRGNLQSVSSVHIMINVTDINDNAPRFAQQSYDLLVDEETPEETELARLHATDADFGRNSEIKYELAFVSDEIKAYFSVDPTNGALILKKKLNFHKKKQWHLSVRALDQSWPATSAKSAIVQVRVRVNDASIHRPEINIHFFDVTSKIEPIVLSGANNERKEAVYLSRDIPTHTAIGVASIQDKESNLGEFSQDFRLNLVSSSGSQMPVYLDDYDESKQRSDVFFSSDLELNKRIQLAVKPGATSSAKRFLVRSKVNFNEVKSSSFEVEMRASDNGNENVALTGVQRFKLFLVDFKVSAATRALLKDGRTQELAENEQMSSRRQENLGVHSEDGVEDEENESNEQSEYLYGNIYRGKKVHKQNVVDFIFLFCEKKITFLKGIQYNNVSYHDGYLRGTK